MSFFFFPGQGSQTPGMGRDFYEGSDAARTVFDEAASISEAGFLSRIFQGSDEELKDTRLTQAALVAVEVAIARHLRSRGHAVDGCAGHSVGEIAALVEAGSLAFADALPLTRERARLMTENVPQGGMAAVIGLDAAQIEAVLPPGAEIANFNGPQQTIISGSVEGLDVAERLLKEAGAKRVLRLPVSGPFHSSFLREGAEAFRQFLVKIEFKPPHTRFISSVSASEISDPETIRALLGNQLCLPVRWTEVMAQVGRVSAIEAGPGRVLQGIAKRMEGAAEIASAGTLDAANALAVAS